MAIKRAETREIVVVMSGIPVNSTEWNLSCAYRDKGVSGIGSHYVILADGDVIKPRADAEHGNVDPRFNKFAVFIELMGTASTEITPHQQKTLSGLTSMLEERYVDADVLELYH